MICYSFKQVVSVAKGKPNYIDSKDGREIIFRDNILIVKEPKCNEKLSL